MKIRNSTFLEGKEKKFKISNNGVNSQKTFEISTVIKLITGLKVFPQLSEKK